MLIASLSPIVIFKSTSTMILMIYKCYINIFIIPENYEFLYMGKWNNLWIEVWRDFILALFITEIIWIPDKVRTKKEIMKIFIIRGTLEGHYWHLLFILA